MAMFKTMRNGQPIWHVRWNYRTTADGKQRYDEKRFRSKTEAGKFDNNKTSGHTTSTETIVVRELAPRWLSEHVDVNLSQRTRKDYRCHLVKRILLHLGHRQVSKLTPIVVKEWRDRLIAEGNGPRTVNKSLDTLKAMIRWGRSEGLCTNSMIDDVRRVKEPRPKPANPYTPEQIRHIVRSTPWMREAVLIEAAAYTGLRWSELRALRWSDVHLDHETPQIHLRRALDLDRGFKSPKSGVQRVVPILSPGVRALRAWRENIPDAVLVFPTRNGNPLNEHNWYGQRLPKIREASGIEFDLHEMRDTYASLLIQVGVAHAELTMWLGHRRIQTTIDRYGALFEQYRARKVNLVDEGLKDLFGDEPEGTA